MFGTRPRPPVDKNAYDPSPVKSWVIEIEKTPNLDRLPTELWPFAWFFFRQIKLPLFLIATLFVASYVCLGLMPLYAREVILIFENATDKSQIWPTLKPVLISFVLVVMVMQAGFYHSARYIWSQITITFRSLIVRQLNLFLQQHSLTYFQNDFAGRLSNKVNDTADGLRSLMRDTLYALMYAAVNAVLAAIMIAKTGWVFSLIFVTFLCFYALILSYFMPIIIRASMRLQDSKTRITGQVVDVVSNIYNVKIFSRGRYEDERLTGYLNDMSRKGRWMSFGFNKMYMFIEANSFFLWVSCFGLLIYRIETGQSSLADAALIVPVVMSVSQITWWLSDALVVFLETMGSVKDGIATIVKPFGLVDKPNAAALNNGKGNIALRDVNFTYPGRPVFENLNLVIPAGQKVGLVGPSGAGKSTLVQLLLRLHDIQKGEIMIGDQNIADVTQESLRHNVGVIPQHSDLLHRSIRENIAYGDLNATEEQIIAAAKRAHAHDFILGLHDQEGRTGYDAMVGERGVKLSGGQRQRIAIARAILKDAPILLLDEATSALDSESERLIQESLTDLMEGRTVIAIAHRLSTIARLDRLIVMDEGRIVEDGTHQQLLAAKGLYAHLWSLQSGGFLGDGHN